MEKAALYILFRITLPLIVKACKVEKKGVFCNKKEDVMTQIRMNTRDRVTLLLLTLMSVFLFADQRIMSAILP